MSKNFLLATVLTCFIFISTTEAAVLDGAKQYNGHYYKYFDYALPWSEALIYCESMGGHLATIGSEKEQYVAESAIRMGSKNCYWIGAKRDGNLFVWIDTNKPVLYSKWRPGEPNNYYNAEDCVAMQGKHFGNQFGMWNDLRNEADTSGNWALARMGFICEWENAESAHESDY